jgi:hypothetical protein
MPQTLEVSQLLAQTFQTKNKWQWILEIDGIDAFTLKTCQRPQITFEEIVIDYINTKRYLSGKGSFNPIQITLHDPIAPSAAQKVMEWTRLNYEVLTGRMGYAAFYKKDFTLKLLDPQGTVVEKWVCNGGWAMDSNFGELNYATSEPVEIQVSIRCDAFILEY